MIFTSKKTLINLAAIVWIVGGMILFLKTYSMLKQAMEIDSNYFFVLLAIVSSFAFGLLKNKFIMSPFCVKNLRRIEKLENPKIHQFFELKFLFQLFLMILFGAFLSRIATGNFYGLLLVGILDLALSIALLTSSVLFFRNEVVIQN